MFVTGEMEVAVFGFFLFGLARRFEGICSIVGRIFYCLSLVNVFVVVYFGDRWVVFLWFRKFRMG